MGQQGCYLEPAASDLEQDFSGPGRSRMSVTKDYRNERPGRYTNDPDMLRTADLDYNTRLYILSLSRELGVEARAVYYVDL